MMRLLFSFIVFFAVTLCAAAEEVVIDFADPMFAQLDAEGKRLLSEYAKAYPKVKKFYGNIRLDAIVKETNYRAQEKDQLESLRSVLESAGLDENEIKYRLKHAGQTERQYDVRYRSDGYARMDTKTSYTATASKHVDLPLGIPQRVVIHEVGITLFTPAMGYQLSKSDPAKQYFSLNVKRNFGKQNTEGIITVVMYFDTAPFSSDDIPLEHLVFQCPPAIKGKPYIVEYVRQRKVDGENIVEIKCSRTDLMNSFRKIRLIRDSWMVKETYSMSGVTIPGKGREVRWNRETCTYDNIVDGTPLLKTYQRSFGTCDKETQEEIIAGKVEYKVTNLVPGPPELSEFDVAQFLPPDVKIGKDISPAHFSPIRIAAIVVGLILFILGIYMKIRYC